MRIKRFAARIGDEGYSVTHARAAVGVIEYQKSDDRAAEPVAVFLSQFLIGVTSPTHLGLLKIEVQTPLPAVHCENSVRRRSL